MALLPIITVPDPLLRRESAPVERIDDDLRRLAQDMLATMYEAPGVGLAAVQVAVPRRLIVVDITKPDEPARNPIVMVNPRVVETIGDDLQDVRGGLPVDPRCLCRGRAAGEGQGRSIPTSTAASRNSSASR